MTTYPAADLSIDQLKKKIQQREARVGIIGLGYVGLPLALLYSEQKFNIEASDIKLLFGVQQSSVGLSFALLYQ